MAATLHQVRHRDRAAPPRGGQRRPGRDRHEVQHAAAHGRPADHVQVRPQGRGLAGGQAPDLHAQAHLRGQRLGHAHPPVAVEGRRAAVLRRGRLRGAVRHRPLVHRWSAAPRPLDDRLHQPDDQQLQAAGAGLRGAGQPRLQPAQPLGVVPHPAGVEEPEGQAGRVPLPRQHLEPVPGLLGDDDGGPRRHRQPHRAAGAGRQGPLRPAARGAGAGAPGPVVARRGAAGARGRPRLPDAPAACSPTTSSRRGSSTSARTRSTRSACARIPTSSPCTTTSSQVDPPAARLGWPNRLGRPGRAARGSGGGAAGYQPPGECSGVRRTRRVCFALVAGRP